jgi:hypothetical protein
MANSLPVFSIRKRVVNMKDEVFLPKIFAYCSNFNTSGCLESENIQKLFYSKIGLLEIKVGDEFPDTGEVGKIMIEISKKYCQSCSNFSTKKELLG